MSITIIGLLISFLAWLSQNFGLNFTESEAEATIKVLVELGGLFVALFGRLRIGDLRWWGGRK